MRSCRPWAWWLPTTISSAANSSAFSRMNSARRSGRWLSMSEEALMPASIRLRATASPNRNDSGIDSFSSVAPEVTIRSLMCTTSTSESNALARPVTTGTSSVACSVSPTATTILENTRRLCTWPACALRSADGRSGPALPGGAQEKAWRVGAIPEGKLRTPRPAGEPRAGDGGRRGGRRRPPVAPLGIERRIPGAVRHRGARAPGHDRAGHSSALAQGAGRGPEMAGARGCGDRAAAAWPREHAAADRRDGGLVERWSAGAEGGGRRTVRAGFVEEARRGPARAAGPRPHHTIDGGYPGSKARRLSGAPPGDGLLLERGRRGQPGGGATALREVAAFVRPGHRMGNEEQPRQGAAQGFSKGRRGAEGQETGE